MSATTASLPETFESSFEESNNGYFKKLSIVRSTSASVSVFASLLLVWILHRSRSRFTTTYHRLMLGISFIDLLFSASFVTFGLASPTDVNYVFWNARGNLATCNAFGFMGAWGVGAAPMYSASLNLYYLAKITYNKPDAYIARRLEPLFHAVPILWGLAKSTVYVTQEGINVNENGLCGTWPYNPPHCDGFEDGQIPDGFEIPCGRGNSFYQGAGFVFLLIYVVVTIFVVPLTIGGSLFMIYRTVSRQEQRMSRYGGDFERRRPANDDDVEGDDEEQNNRVTKRALILSSVVRSIRNISGRGSELRNQGSSTRLAVSHRAAAYSVSYFVTNVWVMVYYVVTLTGARPTENIQPGWVVAVDSLTFFFLPLQGLWTFLIYMHPKVVHAKRTSDRDISWFGAFLDALWLATTGCKRPPCSCRTGRRKDATPHGIQGKQGSPVTP